MQGNIVTGSWNQDADISQGSHSAYHNLVQAPQCQCIKEKMPPLSTQTLCPHKQCDFPSLLPTQDKEKTGVNIFSTSPL